MTNIVSSFEPLSFKMKERETRRREVDGRTKEVQYIIIIYAHFIYVRIQEKGRNVIV